MFYFRICACLWWIGPRGVQYSDLADSLFDEFNTRFWLRPGNNFKLLCYLYI